MLRSLPALISIMMLVLGPRACCLSAFVNFSSAEASPSKSQPVRECKCCQKHSRSTQENPKNEEKRECPCKKGHAKNNAIISSMTKSIEDQSCMSWQFHFLSFCNVDRLSCLTEPAFEPICFPRLCAASLLKLISISRC